MVALTGCVCQNFVSMNKFKTLIISKALVSRLYQQDKRIDLFNMLDYSFNNDKNNNYMYKTYK